MPLLLFKSVIRFRCKSSVLRRDANFFLSNQNRAVFDRPMFNGGNEGGIEAIVLDFGSYSSRIGFAGEDSPRCIVPTDVGVDKGASPSYVVEPYYKKGKETMEIHNPMNERGLIEDWDAIEAIFDHACADSLSIEASEHPVMLAEPNFNTRALRERFTELLFEKYDIPALFISKSAVLSCFANGRSSGLVIDLGATQSSVVPVQEGFVLQKNAIYSQVGGNCLDEYFYSLLNAELKSIRHPGVRALWEVQSNNKLPDSSKSFQYQSRLRVIQQVKEGICRASDTTFDLAQNISIPKVPYELPDGSTIHIGPMRFEVPELLFQTKSAQENSLKTIPNHFSIQKMVNDATNTCEIDFRRDLYHNIILTGGSSCFENLPTRLERELAAVVPTMFKMRVVAPHPPERKISSWLGGSILASLGSFHDMWISKSEYAEHGASLIQRKCP